jgi:hypothetical protein
MGWCMGDNVAIRVGRLQDGAAVTLYGGRRSARNRVIRKRIEGRDTNR